MVEISAAAAPTFRLLASAWRTAASANSSPYQRVVKPVSGKAMKALSLNENSGRNSTGT